jgi:hypothetical protein
MLRVAWGEAARGEALRETAEALKPPRMAAMAESVAAELSAVAVAADNARSADGDSRSPSPAVRACC